MVCHDLTNNPSHNCISLGGPAGSAGTPGTPAGPPAASSDRQAPLPCFESDFPPFELDNSSETLTEKLNKILSTPSRNDLLSLEHWQREELWKWEEDNGQGVGACLNVFPSGEISGGCYSLGRKAAPGRRGKLVSREFTRQARKKIRRAVENSKVKFCRFLTVTFDPKKSKLDEHGCVDQKWAKEKYMQFLNTIKKKYDRMAESTGNNEWRISNIWAAEVQKNGNIHFHCLINRHLEIGWLVKIWDQAPNSVNIIRMNDQTHAAKYMLKYMGKDNSPIQGRRYGMTQDLIEDSKPLRLDFYGRARRGEFLKVKEELEWEIIQNNGKVFDWGICLPAPRREVTWRDRKGITRTTRGTSRRIGAKLRQMVEDRMAGVDITDEIMDKITDTPDDPPF